jgi:putative salt-induced outer membrane protein YdiY
VICFSGLANAIVNVENMRVASDNKTEGFDGKLTLDISGKNGNTQKLKAGLGGRAQWYDVDGTRFVVLNYEYGESSDIKDTDKTFLHFRNIWYQSDSWAWEAFTQLENNEFTRLSLRSLLGGGFRWRILHDIDQTAYLGFGVFRSKEKLESVLLVTDAGVTYNNRMNLYLVYKLTLSDHSRLVNTLYYQPDMSETTDYRLLEQISLQMDITENLSFRLSVDVSHDNKPPQLIRKTDTSYNTGFEYKF